MNEAARFYALAQLRAGWRPRLALAVLLGAVGAVAVGSAAGAVRTNSAVDRFLTDQRAFDVLVFCGAPDPVTDGYGCERELRGLDEVEDTASIVELAGLPSVGGRNAEPADDGGCFDGPGDVKLVVSPDGRFGSAINEHRFIAGRPYDPSRPDEIVISRDLAERVDLGVGDTLEFQLFAGSGCEGDPADWRGIALTVVGIEVSPFEVRPESGEYRSFVHATPALLASVGDLPDVELMVAARLHSGVELDDLREPFGRLGISIEALDEEGMRFAVAQSASSDNLQRSMRAHVTTLWLLGALSAVAGLVLVGQMLNRQVRGAGTEFRSLGHLGLTRRDLVSVGLVHLLSVVLPAAVLAGVGGHLSSAFTPLGIARIIEVDRGVRFDPVVLGLGLMVMILGLVAAAVPALVTVTRGRLPAAPPRAGRAGALARRLGGGPVTTTGLRMAFEPLRGPSAPPLRTGVGVILAAVVLLVGATVFAGSLTHLTGSSHLVGWNWDAQLSVDDGEDEPVTDARLREAVVATPGVRTATSGTIFPPLLVLLGPDEVFVHLTTVDGGPIEPTLISGRAPSGPTEIVLGRETLARLGKGEGDQIDFFARADATEDISEETFRGRLTIVGTAVVPVLGGDNRLGTGAAVAFEFFRSLVPGVQSGAVFVRLEPGADVDEVAAAVAESLGADGVGSITEESFGLDMTLRDIDRIKNLPIAFAALLALLAGAVVAQVVVGSTHARRGELGVLRALGLRPRQIQGAIVVQATAVVGTVLVVGIPLGIALGRAAWGAFALSLGTKPEVRVAAGWLVALGVGLVVLAGALGLVGSARPRRRLAAALRRE